MPFPAVLTAGALVTALKALAAYMTFNVLKRLAICAAVVTATTLVLSTLKDTLTALVMGIAVSAPGGVIASGLAMLPANTLGCISAIVATRVAVWTALSMISLIRMKAGGAGVAT